MKPIKCGQDMGMLKLFIYGIEETNKKYREALEKIVKRMENGCLWVEGKEILDIAKKALHDNPKNDRTNNIQTWLYTILLGIQNGEKVDQHLLSIIGSWKDTMNNEETLEALKEYVFPNNKSDVQNNEHMSNKIDKDTNKLDTNKTIEKLDIHPSLMAENVQERVIVSKINELTTEVNRLNSKGRDER
jgi:hypothetical protein